MKPLLLCASSSRTGPVEGLISLAVSLRSLGVEAHFAGDTVRPGEDLPGHLREASVPFESSLRLSRRVKVPDVLHDARLLSSWVRQGRFDVLHTTFAHDNLLALWARRRGCIVVRAAQRRVDLDRLWALRKSDGVIVHSQQYLSQLRQHLQNVEYVPPSVDASRFTPREKPWTHRFGIVARMKRERGHEVLLRAFAKAGIENSELVLFGRGEDEQRLRSIAASLAPARITFAGYARGDALVEAYRSLDCAVWLREGNDGACRGVLEAMACGLPMIVGSDGAPGEVVRDGVDGRVVDPSSECEIVAALKTISPGMGAKARARAQEFTPLRSAEITLNFWKRLREHQGEREPRT